MKKQIASIVLAMCSVAQAGTFWDGNKLYGKLQGNNMEQMQALGYVMGVSDAEDTATICSPNTVTSGQMFDIVKQYLENNPTVRHYPADMLVKIVLGRVWPCEKKKGQSL